MRMFQVTFTIKFSVSKRGPVDDIQIIDSSANDTIISFDKV